ncbi:hypothetical protein HGA34_03025 [Candidatus Falkowbacteria bacterium]|nr:hypothetical protein [Candidatus Falkowbacteria bacterium]
MESIKNIHLKILSLSLVSLFVVLLLGNSFSYLDNDFGWHLLAGKEILKNGQVPQVADYSHTLPGAAWVDHEWLIDAVTYFLYDRLGYITVSIFFAAIILAVFIILYRRQFARLEKSVFWFFALGFLAYFAARHSLGVRMQEVTLLGLLLELSVIDNFQKSRRSKDLYWLVPLFLIWANLHAGFLVGLALLLGYFVLMALLDFGRRWQDRLKFIDFSQTLPLERVRVFGLWAVLAAASTLVNPYGWKMYDFFFSFGNTYYLTAISEWMPFYFFPQQPLVVLYLCLVATALILVLVKVINRSRGFKIDLWWLSLVLLFWVMSLKSRRHTPLLAVVSLPWLVDIFSKEFVVANVRQWLVSKRARIIIGTGSAVFFSLAAFCFTKVSFTNSPFDYYCGYFPCAAVAELKSSVPAPARVLNDFNWGGYLLWQWPGLPLFVDGRQPQHGYEDHTILEEYHRFFKEGEADKYLKKHRIDMVMLSKPRDPEITWFNRLLFGITESDLRADSHLIDYLKSAKEWRNCFEDGLAIAFCKN